MKPLVKDWISEFLDRHRARFAPHDWPDAATDDWIEFVKGWITALATRQISEAEADEASRNLALDPPQWRRDHVPAVVRAVEALRGAKAGPPAASDDRAAAERASRDCPGCGGSGYGTVVDARRSEALGHEIRFACLCPLDCPMSRWVRRQLSQGEPETLRRLEAAARYGDAENESCEEFDAAALARWNDTPEDDRESWRLLVRERCAFLAKTPLMLELMSMAWCHDPALVIAAPPPRRPADARGPRQVLAAPPSVLVPTPEPEPEATVVAVAAPGPGAAPTIDLDEEF